MNKKILPILSLLSGLLLSIKLFAKPKKAATPTRSGTIRPCDPQGCGLYDSPRSGRKHEAVDYLANVDDPIATPIYGTITRFPYPYTGDTSLQGVEVLGNSIHTGYEAILFYVKPMLPIGRTVIPGQVVGKAQNVAAKYGGGMQNHVHLELYFNGKRIDPQNFIL